MRANRIVIPALLGSLAIAAAALIPFLFLHPESKLILLAILTAVLCAIPLTVLTTDALFEIGKTPRSRLLALSLLAAFAVIITILLLWIYRGQAPSTTEILNVILAVTMFFAFISFGLLDYLPPRIQTENFR